MTLDLIIVTHLKYKKTNAYIRTVVRRHIDMLASKEFTVHEIQADMEGGLDALRGRLSDVNMEVVGARLHMVIAERKYVSLRKENVRRAPRYHGTYLSDLSRGKCIGLRST